MSLTQNHIAEAARQLNEAEQARQQMDLISLRHPEATMDDAYAIQAEWMAQKKRAGRKVIGWKIGLTSKAMQQQLGITTPDSGVLLDDMLFASGETIPANRFIQPRVEAEIAFVMKAGLKGPNITPADVLAATDYVAPSLEILDTRILRIDPVTKKMRNIVDTISDNAANGGIVMGDGRFDPRKTDMRWMGAILSRNGEVEETGLGAGVLNDPALGIAWLANRLAQYGDEILPGQIVLSGSFVRAIEAPSGSHIVGDFGQFGKVTCQFA